MTVDIKRNTLLGQKKELTYTSVIIEFDCCNFFGVKSAGNISFV